MVGVVWWERESKTNKNKRRSSEKEKNCLSERLRERRECEHPYEVVEINIFLENYCTLLIFFVFVFVFLFLFCQSLGVVVVGSVFELLL